MKIPQALQIAIQRHQAGRLADAEVLYRQILAVQPNHADALHLLGVVAHQAGRHDLAVQWIRKAIAVNPAGSSYYLNIGSALAAQGQLEEAIASFRRAVELKPDYPEAHYNLGNALAERGEIDKAVDAYRHALEFKADYAEAHYNLGNALRQRGESREAVASYRRALELKPGYPQAFKNLGATLREQRQLDEAVAVPRMRDRAIERKPDFPEAWNNLGVALQEKRQFAEAADAFRRALELKPDYAEAHSNLGSVLREQGRFVEAIAACRRALELKPDDPKAHNHLGNALREQGQLDAAIAAWLRAVELEPDLAQAHNNLGTALRDRGELDEAIAAYRRALQFQPDYALAHSNLIFALHLHPGHDGGTIAAEHQRWNRQFSDPLKPFILPHANDPATAGRLRVGYVSPDFRSHPVGRFALPLFERHDREQFEILCYSGVTRPDPMTERLRALAGKWRNTVGIPDAQLAEMIREDEVDILVDLTMHAGGNRLPVFARQPAPVQVAWLGYPGSTGLDSIGYRLTDARLDPPGSRSRGTAWFAEEPVRLPDCWCCYDPLGESPEINALPALSAGGVTFGSLNSIAKVNEGVLALWARALEAAKGSKLLMLCPQGLARERVQAFFVARGIAADRLELVGLLPRLEYLRLYHRIDIALDPFPYNGMTMTCDALWMGAPVLTLSGEMPVSRAGLSLLSTIDLAELAASSEEDYLRIAIELAGNLPRLADFRAAMRPRMQASPLMDAPRFARNVEAAYRSMWERWRLAGA